MARAHLSVFGGFKIAGGEAAEAKLTRKARALLAYLALQSGHSQSREKLAALLWGGTGDLQARTNLRQALSVIRKALPSEDGGRFRSEGDRIVVNLNDVDIDVAEFERLAGSSAPDDFEKAITLYRGDLLDGFGLKAEPFEDWLRTERERLRAVAVAMLEKLAAHHSARADGAGSVRAASRLLAFEPFREDMHRVLMRAYAAQDRINLALKQYKICRDALQRELGLQREPETRQLYEALRPRRMSPPGAGNPPPSPAPSRRSDLAVNGQAAAQAPRPATHYVKSSGCNIAYQVTGSGPLDMIYVPGWVSNLDYAWASPRVTEVFERLGAFCRLIRCDKRGTGLSDRNVGLPTLEQRMEDVRAVLDAIGSMRTVVFGSSEGATMCMLFAATYPERTAALVLNGAYARGLWAEDYPWAKTKAQLEDELAEIERCWGEPFDLRNASPSLVHDRLEREWFAAYLRNSASPADALSLWRWGAEIDVRGMLPAIRVPTLVVQSSGDRWVRVEEGRYLARHIEEARYLELAGDDHVIWGEDSGRLVDEIEAFVTELGAPSPAERVLLTVLALKVDGTRSQRRYGDQLLADLRAGEGKDARRLENGVLSVFQGPTRAIQCAMRIRDRMQALGIQLSAAIHVGECERRSGDLHGSAIELASRLLDLAEPSEILTTRTVRDLAASPEFIFRERGTTEAPDPGGPWQYYAIDTPSM